MKSIQRIEQRLDLVPPHKRAFLLVKLAGLHMRTTPSISLARAQEALDLSEDRDDAPGIIAALDKMSEAQGRMQLFHPAAETYTRLLSYLRLHDDHNLLHSVLNRMGVVCLNLCECEDALRYFTEALQNERAHEDSAGMSATLNNIALTYERMTDYENARLYHEQSLTLKEQLGFRNGVAKSLNNLGNLAVKSDELDSAMELYQQSLAIKRELHDILGIAYSLNNLGKVHELRGEYESAIDCYRQSYAFKLRKKDRYGAINTLHNLGKVYAATKDTTEALKFFRRALRMAERLHARDMQRMLYSALAETYAEIHEYRAAYEFHCRYTEIREELYGETKQKNFIEMQTRFRIAEKEHEAEMVRLRNTELAEALRQLEEVNRRLDAAQSEKLELERLNTALAVAITANHDINQPLMIISGSLELLRAKMEQYPLNESAMVLFDRIQNALVRIGGILKKYSKATHIRFTNYSSGTKMAIFDEQGENRVENPM